MSAQKLRVCAAVVRPGGNSGIANPDGSITLYFRNESPGKDEEANWLPAPTGEFIPMLRVYWPQGKAPSILDGTWTPPTIQKVQ